MNETRKAIIEKMDEARKAIIDAMTMAYAEAERLQREGNIEETKMFYQRAEQLRQLLIET